MDIIEKCKLITNNDLINNQSYGNNDEIDLEIYTEIRDTIIEHLENIINPIINDYKAIKKNIFYNRLLIKLQEEIKIKDLLSHSMSQHSEIEIYLKALDNVNQNIKELTDKINKQQDKE